MTKHETKRKIPPFPIELLVYNPIVLTFPAAAFGILCRIAIHYWLTECRPLPTQTDDLYAIGRAQRPTMKTWGTAVMAVFNDIKPELDSRFRAYQNRRANVLRLAETGRTINKLKALSKRHAAQPPDTLTPPTPKHAARIVVAAMPTRDSWSD